MSTSAKAKVELNVSFNFNYQRFLGMTLFHPCHVFAIKNNFTSTFGTKSNV